MDLDFLTPDQIQLALRLADILSLDDLSVAAAVLASYNWNLQSAVNDMPLAPPSINQLPIINNDTYQNYPEQQYYDQEDNYQYQKFQILEAKRRQFQQKHISLVPLSKTLSQPRKDLTLLQFHKSLAEDSKIHRNQYLLKLMKHSQQLCQNILASDPKKLHKYEKNYRRVQNNRKFINRLYTQYQPRWNFTFGTFFLNLSRAYLEGKHLMVYVHSESREKQTGCRKVLELLFRQKQIAEFVNDRCIIYGIFDNSDEYDLLQKYLPLKDLPAIGLFSMNKANKQEQFIASYKILGQKQVFLEWLAQNIGVKLNKRKSVKQQPKFIEKPLKRQPQKQNYNAHQYIKQQQDQLYFQLQKTYNQKRQLSLERKQKIHEDQQNLAQRISQALKIQQPPQGSNTIEIRFRLPNYGDTKSRRFLLQDKVQRLFQFVDCFCRDSFEEKFTNFDLLQTHPRLLLNDLKEKSINQVWEESNRQNVIVRES